MRLFLACVLHTYASSLTAGGYSAGVSFPIGLASFFPKRDYGLFPFLGPPAVGYFKAIAVFSLAWKTRYVGGLSGVITLPAFCVGKKTCVHVKTVTI